MTKQCIKCKQIKPLRDFSKKNSAKSGAQSACKICVSIQQSTYYEKNRERLSQQQRKNRTDKTREYEKKYNKKNKAKRYAHRKAQYAIEKGLLPKQTHCSCCGLETNQLVKHHSDYSKPLVITWLCNPCHGIYHRINSKIHKAPLELILPNLVQKKVRF